MLETHACLKRPINIQGGLYPCTGRMKDERITKPNWARMVHKLILIPAGSVRPLSSGLRVILAVLSFGGVVYFVSGKTNCYPLNLPWWLMSKKKGLFTVRLTVRLGFL